MYFSTGCRVGSVTVVVVVVVVGGGDADDVGFFVGCSPGGAVSNDTFAFVVVIVPCFCCCDDSLDDIDDLSGIVLDLADDDVTDGAGCVGRAAADVDVVDDDGDWLILVSGIDFDASCAGFVVVVVAFVVDFVADFVVDDGATVGGDGVVVGGSVVPIVVCDRTSTAGSCCSFVDDVDADDVAAAAACGGSTRGTGVDIVRASIASPRELLLSMAGVFLPERGRGGGGVDYRLFVLFCFICIFIFKKHV